MLAKSKWYVGVIPGRLAAIVLTIGLASCLAIGEVPAEASNASQVGLVDARTELLLNPLGIDAERPRYSWKLVSARRGTTQTAYQIQVFAVDEKGARTTPIWDSGKVASDNSVNVPYGGPPLVSRRAYQWRARIWDDLRLATQWTAPAHFEMGLLSPADWTAEWISPRNISSAVPMLRRDIILRSPIKSARVYTTSRGVYQLFINGTRVGDMELAPGFTSYDKRIQYQTYDVSRLLKRGKNAIGALIGSGWYRNFRKDFGPRPEYLMQLEVTYLDGSVERITTDSQWKSSAGPILMSTIYAGETYDARLERPGWSTAGFDDRDWHSVIVGPRSDVMLVAQATPPVRRIERIVPKSIVQTPDGRTIVDMGQNMVGWVRISARGAAGTTVTLRHAEALDARGDLYTENLGKADQTVRYTLKGKGRETFEPHFTFQGFRYVSVEGYPGKLTLDRIAGIVLHSDLTPTGEFETSNPKLNQLQHNIVWGMKGNILDIPTDSPQRDERLAWTGDAQVFASTAAYNFNVLSFFEKWLKDVALEQSPNGSIRWVAPDVVQEIDFEWMTGAPETTRKRKQDAGGVAGWSDAATIIPWAMYAAYGDRRILETQYRSMVRWVEYERSRAGPDLIWDGDFQFGDHGDVTFEDFGVPEGNYSSYGGATDRDLIATAYFAHSASILARVAAVLGKDDDAARWRRLFENVKVAFQRRFVSPEAVVGTGTQTSYVLALQFDLLPQQQRAAAAKNLAKAVRHDGHLTTGALGTRWLLFALSEYGHLDEAYGLLLREEYPSWLYPLKHGATTLWERWNGIRPDGSIPTAVMGSFNHPYFGSVGDWMYRVIGGIDADEAVPGYKRVAIRPKPGGELSWARARHSSPYGMISTQWRREGNQFRLRVTLPPNTSGSIQLPFAALADVSESGKALSRTDGLTEVRQAGADLVVEAGSGKYDFTYTIAPALKNAE